jgi:hypothetical protein
MTAVLLGWDVLILATFLIHGATPGAETAVGFRTLPLP